MPNFTFVNTGVWLTVLQTVINLEFTAYCYALARTVL